MRALLFVLQLVFWLLLIRIVLRGLARFVSGPRDARQRRRGAPPPVEDLVRDPICHTYVPRSRALPARIEGREEAFCSAGCRDKALAAVARAS